jgi:hypothetical protein
MLLVNLHTALMSESISFLYASPRDESMKSAIFETHTLRLSIYIFLVGHLEVAGSDIRPLVAGTA